MGHSEGIVCAVVPENKGALCQVRWESHHQSMTKIVSDLKAENHTERLAENTQFQQVFGHIQQLQNEAKGGIAITKALQTISMGTAMTNLGLHNRNTKQEIALPLPKLHKPQA